MGQPLGAIEQQVINKDQAITPAGNGQWAGSEPESCYLTGSESTGQGHMTSSRGKGTREMGVRGNL